MRRFGQRGGLKPVAIVESVSVGLGIRSNQEAGTVQLAGNAILLQHGAQTADGFVARLDDRLHGNDNGQFPTGSPSIARYNLAWREDIANSLQCSCRSNFVERGLPDIQADADLLCEVVYAT